MATQTTERSLDELAKGLASGTLSRGKAIRWMGGALLGAALASVPGVAWADGGRRLGRDCRRDSQCCSRNCIRRGDDKVCGCPEGKTRCKDRCVNLQRNENHCGSREARWWAYAHRSRRAPTHQTHRGRREPRPYSLSSFTMATLISPSLATSRSGLPVPSILSGSRNTTHR